MKKNYTKFLFLALLAFGLKANAQCSSCTTTISGNDFANHVVSSGTTLCITSTGIANGLITVSSGGILCNQGTIQSTNVWVAGGTLNNYGTVNTNKVLVSAQGIYNNYATAYIDSLLIENIYSALNNSGALTGTCLGNADYSSITNTGSITEDYLADSAAQFNNNTNAMLKVNTDFYNAYSSGFFNYGYMEIDHDFYNSTSATFQTQCMINVGHDWYNSATVTGPPTGSCGGFSIAGVSASSGTIGSSTTHIDLCDAGHPGTGIDGPGGTIASTTTYCACSNNCVLTGILEAVAQSSVLIKNVYPNPASSDLTIDLQNKESEQITVEVMDMLGKKHFSNVLKATVGENKTTVDVSSLAQGMYILKITDSHQLQATKLFNVVK